MIILVRKVGDVWSRWQGVNDTFSRTVTTYNASYADGREIEMSCDPYTAPAVLSSEAVERAVDAGTWTADDLSAYGLKVATPFVVPDGKQITGEATYVENGDAVDQVYSVGDIPPPPPELTPLEKLAAAAGMTPEELQAVIAAAAAAGAA